MMRRDNSKQTTYAQQRTATVGEVTQERTVTPDERDLFQQDVSLFYKYVVCSPLWMSASLASLTLLTQVVLYEAPAQKRYEAGLLPMKEGEMFVVRLDWVPFLVVFFEALIIYATDHLGDAKKNNKHKKAAGNLRWIRLLRSVGLVGLIVILVLQRSVPGVILVVIHASLGLLYSKNLWKYQDCTSFGSRNPTVQKSFPAEEIASRASFLSRPTVKRVRLKDIPYFKSVFVAMTVTLMVVACPLVLYRDDNFATHEYSQTEVWKDIVVQQPLLMFQLCATIFVLSLVVENLQDIRDVVEDWKAGTKTLPVGMGIRKTKIFLVAFTGAAQFIHFLPVHFGFHGPHVALVGTFFIVKPLLLSFGRKTPPHWFTYLEALHCLPILQNWILRSWFGLDEAFLTEPNESNPVPWHLPLTIISGSFVIHRDMCYLNSTMDKDDLRLHHREGYHLITLVGNLAALVSGAGVVLMCTHLLNIASKSDSMSTSASLVLILATGTWVVFIWHVIASMWSEIKLESTREKLPKRRFSTN